MNTEKKVILSKEQETILEWFRGKLEFLCVVIIARAGSGKTFIALMGILQSLEIARSKTSKILYCCFMKRNQTEALEKITHAQVSVQTFSAVGYGIIVKHWPRSRANAFCEWNRAQVICPSLKEPKLKYLLIQTTQLIDFCKAIFIGVPSVEDIKKQAEMRDFSINKTELASGWNLDKVCEIVRDAMQFALTDEKEFSFADMAGWLPMSLGIVKGTYNLIVEDEGQDLSLPQLAMAKALLLPGGRLAIIGDNFQSMYS
jgi:hypothetical protein